MSALGPHASEENALWLFPLGPVWNVSRGIRRNSLATTDRHRNRFVGRCGVALIELELVTLWW